jgi:hypothetical protein
VHNAKALASKLVEDATPKVQAGLAAATDAADAAFESAKESPLVDNAKAEASKFVEGATPQAQEAFAAAARAVDSAQQVGSSCGVRKNDADEDAGAGHPECEGSGLPVRR